MTQERATVFQGTQLGAENAPGTLTPANLRLGSVGVMPGIKTSVKSFTPRGSKYATIRALGTEHTEAGLEGVPDYNEIGYLLASVLARPVTTVVGAAGSGVFRHVFRSASSAADQTRTYTAEVGGPGRAERFTGGQVTELGLELDRDEFELDGSMIGKRLETGIAMTAGAVERALVPVLPGHVSLYLADTQAALAAATALERALSMELSIEDRFGPVWAINRAYNSYAALVETEPEIEVELQLEADAVGLGLLETMRQGLSKFFRMEAVGPEIAPAQPYRLVLDLATQVDDVDDFDDEDGVYAITWTLGAVHDPTWGRSIEVVLTNKVESY